MSAQVVVFPPAVEPVTLDEMKLWLRLDDETVEDGLISGLIATARAAAELYTGRAFISRTLRFIPGTLSGRRSAWFPGHFALPVDFFDGNLPSTLELPTQPVRSIVSATTYDAHNVGTLYAASNYTLLGSSLALNSGAYWPGSLRTGSPAEITYVAGYGDAPADVPAPIRTAVKMHAAEMYESRGTCGDDMPSRCELLLRPYRVMPR